MLSTVLERIIKHKPAMVVTNMYLLFANAVALKKVTMLQTFLTTVLMFDVSNGFINREANCRYSANYTIIREGEYFKSSKEHIAVLGSTKTMVECSLHCTMNDTCVFFNYNNNAELCKLVQSFDGTFVANPDWVFISTNYDDWKYRGPMCQILRPQCDFNVEYCTDSCAELGYTCKKFLNVALGKTVTITDGVVEVYKPDRLTDGILRSYFFIRVTTDAWVRIDLAEKFKILFMRLVNTTSKRLWQYSKIITIRIGSDLISNRNSICVSNKRYTELQEYYIHCDSGYLTGDKVYLEREHIDKEQITFELGEFEVFAF